MKQTIFSARKCVSALFFLLSVTAISVFAQTTAFTYQGRFTDATVQQPTNGNYTMTFRLFDALTGGNQIPNNSTAVTSMVSVVNGIFTTRLDFGAAAFNTTGARYLEIQVGSTVLTPRQEITSSPFANRAVNAASADSLSNACVGCVTNGQINSINGAKVTGTVANATAAQTAQTATTAGNVSGVVAIANGGTGSSEKNFVDLTTDQTIGGNKVFNGTLSGAGVSGLIKVFPLNGSAGTIPTNGGFVFIGQTAIVTLTDNQQISGAMTAYLGRTTAGNTTVEVAICYQPDSTGQLYSLGLSSFLDINNLRVPYTVTMSNRVSLSAGSYQVGYCVYNFNSTLNANGRVTGWLMVTNN